MMDWIHCNTCFGLPTSDRKFQVYITTCGHLFCDGCLKKAADKKCPMCAQVYSSAIPLSKDVSAIPLSKDVSAIPLSKDVSALLSICIL